MTQADVPAVMRLQARCYHPSMLEDEAVFRTRLDTVPDLSWVVDANKGISAYLVAYRSRLGKPGALGASFNNAEDADTLYLHDLAVDPTCKGKGLGPSLVRMALDRAVEERFAYSSLVSVQASSDFWMRQGYAVWTKLDEQQAAVLHTYPGPACYMVNTLVNKCPD